MHNYIVRARGSGAQGPCAPLPNLGVSAESLDYSRLMQMLANDALVDRSNAEYDVKDNAREWHGSLPS